LPEADAIVNTKLPDCPYPMKGICGAYTAFHVVQVLYDICHGTRTEQGVAGELVPLVGFAALATVCDVMDLVGENRILVKEGLKLLPKTENAGMRALIKASGLEGRELNSYHFGFILGPALNSAGRLRSAQEALELFFMEDEAEQNERAAFLVDLNQQRKQMTQDGTDQAIALVERQREEQGSLDDVLVVYLPDCHESIAGIVAAKVKEKYFRPAIVLTDPAEGSSLQGSGVVKGSGRSIPAYSMFEKLLECREYLLKFGGHPLAAGLSLKKEDMERFRIALNEASGLTEKDFVERVSADLVLPFSALTVELVEELALLQPFGNGNDDPVFGLMNVKILAARRMGSNQQYLRLTLSDDSCYARLEAPMFHGVDEFCEKLAEKYGEGALEDLLNQNVCDYRMNMLYCPEINEFRDEKRVQIRVIDFQF
jgi:single-stranded-DNA-specific exonuclease